ncbi:GNAT family N-acetyltransferase [Candidatus Woesebacteria bacterium]|nr:GNAT family N-acetyltransferase [Candidatus Woesebacteria bacterium]
MTKLAVSNNLNFFHYKKDIVRHNDFQAGVNALDLYVKKNMSQNEERNLSRHYIGIDGNETFISLLCLSTSVLRLKDLNEPADSYPSFNELPTIKIGRLVVDRRFRKKDYGVTTLKKAISIFIEISKKIGAIGLTVDAKNDATTFYEKYGFTYLNKRDEKKFSPMILYTKTLRKNHPSLFEDSV